jgi:hypothetical protein
MPVASGHEECSFGQLVGDECAEHSFDQAAGVRDEPNTGCLEHRLQGPRHGAANQDVGAEVGDAPRARDQIGAPNADFAALGLSAPLDRHQQEPTGNIQDRRDPLSVDRDGHSHDLILEQEARHS